jgi:leucine-rich repeat protein SHOC2
MTQSLDPKQIASGGYKTVDWSQRKLGVLPSSISLMTSVQRWWLNGCVGELDNTNVIICSPSNELEALPKETAALTNLRELWCNDNNLESIANVDWRRLVFLETLRLNNVRLSDAGMPATLPSSLVYLELNTNRLCKVAPALFEVTSLAKLDLSYNQIDKLPNEIGRLVSLVQLDLSHNEIPALPSSIGELTRLETLSLSKNRLSLLPSPVRVHVCVGRERPQYARTF